MATQANVAVSYGPRALGLLAQGLAAPEALTRLLAEDPHRATRQVAIVDARGAAAAHTGESCVPAAGDCAGPGVCCQANVVANRRVWPAMLEAFQVTADRSLTQRLLAALNAAQQAGGDLRGCQSAAIVVVPAAGEEWRSVVSLRVEDHPHPLRELSRLVGLHDAYVVAGAGDEAAGAGRHDEAAALYQRASELAPESEELLFWAGLGAAQTGDLATALDRVRAAIAQHPGWRELLARLPPEIAPAAPGVLERLDLPS